MSRIKANSANKSTEPGSTLTILRVRFAIYLLGDRMSNSARLFRSFCAGGKNRRLDFRLFNQAFLRLGEMGGNWVVHQMARHVSVSQVARFLSTYERARTPLAW